MSINNNNTEMYTISVLFSRALATQFIYIIIIPHIKIKRHKVACMVHVQKQAF